MSKNIVVSCGEDNLCQLLKVLDLLVMAIEMPRNKLRVGDVYTFVKSDLIHQLNDESVGKKCLDLFSLSACSQRYEESAKLLGFLCRDSTVYNNFIFKATMLVLENLQICDKEGVISKFIKEIHNLRGVDQKEAVLEYIMCGLRNNFFDLSSKLKDYNFIRKLQKQNTLEILLEAYSIYLDYANDISGFFCSDSQFSQASQMSMEGVIAKFKLLIRNPGDWDIFVLKLIEMLNVSGKSDEVIEVLLNYAEFNPDHLNAHIYVCEYLQNYDPDSERLIMHLEIIAKMCPSDERVLLLIEKWNTWEDKTQDCLKLAFMFLDYPSNGNISKAWKILSGLLCQRKSRKEIKDIKHAFWESRRHSWHWVYFNPSQIGHLAETDLPLIVSKVSVLSYFDNDHKYIAEILKRFPNIKSFDC